MTFLERPCPTTCPFLGSVDCAVCSPTERFIRHYVHGPAICPMDEHERQFCVDDADHCGEGMFSSEELRAMDDQELAKSVMNTWRAYVAYNC